MTSFSGRPPARHPLALAALLAFGCAGPVAAQAQPAASAAAPIVHDIPAGPLAPALNRFAQRVGVVLSFDPALAQGKATAGLQGSHAPASGFAALLAGTGLQAVAQGAGSFTLRPASAAEVAGAAGAASLAEVRVADTRVTDATTEATGSYAPQAVTVGAKAPVAWRDVPQSVSVVTRQRMDDQNMVTIEDALRQTTGVTAIPYGDGTAYFQSRGYTSEVQYDGLPISNGLQYLPQFDLAMYDRIEVLRGPAGVLQGAGSPGGTVNLVRKRPLQEAAVSGSVSGGSWSNLRADIDVSRPLNAEGTVRGRAVLAAQDRDYFYDVAHGRHTLAYGIVEADLGPRTLLTVSGSYQKDRNTGVDYGHSVYSNGTFVNPPRSSFFGTDWSFSNVTSQELFAELSHGFGQGWVAKASFDHRRLEGDARYGYIAGTIGLDNQAGYTLQSQDGHTDWNHLDLNATGPFQWLGRTHQLTVGANYGQRTETALSGGTSAGIVDIFHIAVPDVPLPYGAATTSRIRQLGVYAQARLQLADPLTLVLGARVSRYDSRSRPLLPEPGGWSDAPDVRHRFTPAAGLVYALDPQWSLYASYSDIFVPQTQRAFSGAGLDPRIGRQAEAGVKGRLLGGRLNATAAVFELRDRNRAVADAAHPQFSVALGEVQSRGWETEVSGSPARGWDLVAGYTYLQTKYLTDPVQEGAPFSTEEPRHTLKLWSQYRFQDGTALQGWHAGAGARVVSSTTRGAQAQGGYAVADLQVGYRFNSHLSASLTVNNAFDRTYYARVPARFYGIYGEPRSVMLTLRGTY